jgi:hypothetical protein
MDERITFTLDGAEMAKAIVDESFQHAVSRWEQSMKGSNPKQKQDWLVRVVHLMNELNWADRLIINLKTSSNSQIDHEI